VKKAKQLSLSQAVREATSLCRPEPPEGIPLNLALGRVAAGRLTALLPVPPFAQAARDGYALRRRDRRQALAIAGEVAAGCRNLPNCGPGQALHIMTGAPVPAGCDLVVPLEEAREEKGVVRITGPAAADHIRRTGCDLAPGRRIAASGELLFPEYLALAASAGVSRVAVYRMPKVAVLCTGSELAVPGTTLGPGQIFSTNLLLLQGLIRENGGETGILEIAPDRPADIVGRVAEMLADHPPLLITTGGTGPGRYDLLERVFAELELETVFAGLAVKPGQHTRLGRRGNTLIVALPGPPPAVRLIFNVLVRPLLFKLTGRRIPLPLRVRLGEALTCKGRAITNLKGGIYLQKGEDVTVRPAGRNEASNCVIVLPARTRQLPAGAMVTIHPAR